MRWLFLAVVAFVACDAGAPPKPAPTPARKSEVSRTAPAVPVVTPPPALPPAARHKHAILTVDLSKPDLGLAALPKHGIVVKTWGLGGDETLVLDSDAGTIRQLSNLMGKPPADQRRIVQPSRVQRAMQAAYAAWDEEQNGEMPRATDVREDLYVLDGDEAFYLSGYPIGADGTKGRPLAEKALAVLFQLAPSS